MHVQRIAASLARRAMASTSGARARPEEGLTVKIICLSCGHKVDLGDAYDDYAGLVKCVACGALLEIKTEAGGLRTVAVAHEPAAPVTATVS